jgi:short-subunit dehydrogenase/uncharacterized protein (DUF2062 family)
MNSFKKIFSPKKALMQIQDNPEPVARGFALGSFVGMMPIPGFQMLVSVGIATIFKWNKASACIAVLKTNLATATFIFAFNYWLGKTLFGIRADFAMPEKLNFGFVKALVAAGPEVFFAMTAGGIITGTLLATISYLIIKQILRKKQMINEPEKNLKAMSDNPFTVITGASRGLGKSMARECAKRGFNLVLVALPGENIQSLAKSLKEEFQIETATIEADLTNPQELENVAAWINQNFKINNLVNNAGIGGTLPFDEASPQYVDNILLLNIRALVHLTHKLLPSIRQNRGGHILNIASMASFGPMPFKTVYPASKAFVYSFSRGLNAELKRYGITVSVAHPGGMATNPAVTERINRHNKLVKSTILSPEKTAEICIRQMLKNDTLIIPGIMNKLSWVFFKTCPVWLQLIIFRNSVQKEISIQNEPCYA